MDIVRSLELESFILTKLTKPSVPVNLVGPQVILPLWWVPASRGYSFFVRNKEALACVGPYCQPLHLHPSFDGYCLFTMLTTPCESTNVVDEGGTQEGNDPKQAKPHQQMPMMRGV